MNCFIFSGQTAAYSDLCGTTPFLDLVLHLQNHGVTRILTDSEEQHPDVEKYSFQQAEPELGSGWLAAYSGCISRQSPLELRDFTTASGAAAGVSLACSAKPWEHTTVLTDGRGIVEKYEKNPSPENLETNLCFSGMVWVEKRTFDPLEPVTEGTAAFVLPGFWKCPFNRENYLLTMHNILSGEVRPWPHIAIPPDGVVMNSPVPPDTLIKGTLWVGRNCTVDNGCTLENCVILDNSKTGANSNLRNCLVSAEAVIPPGTVQYDKYLSFFGDGNGREY
jgi:NDP-sugar pyrophosphorylase family protein